jgi:23S rRNA (guanosine2251-2'-O)-methyltransferase
MYKKPVPTQKNQMIFGLHAVAEAVEAGREISKVLLRKGLDGEQCRQLTALLRSRDIPAQFVPPEKLNRVTRKNHQGVIAFVSPVEYARLETLVPMLFEAGVNPLIVVCDGVTDMRNIGAIARSAECAGAHALLLPVRGTAMLSADAVQTSAGALNHLSVCRTSNLHDSLLFLKNSGLKIIAASEKAETSLYRCDLTGPAALLLGAEDVGVAPECLRLADRQVRIPLKGKIESLNVSAAASVLLFEMLRQNDAA